jgi:hypothetical protein
MQLAAPAASLRGLLRHIESHKKKLTTQLDESRAQGASAKRLQHRLRNLDKWKTWENLLAKVLEREESGE